MAERDPNAIVSEGWIDKKADFEGLKIPDQVDKNKLGTEFYAYQRVYKNGRRVIEWYKRGSGGGADGKGDAVLTTVEDVVQGTREKWEEGEAKEQKDTAPPGGVPTKTINGQVFRWNPETRAYDLPTGEAPAPSTPSQAAAPGGKPFIDDGPEAGASGRRWGWNPDTRLYDRDLGPSPAAQKPKDPGELVGKPTGNTDTVTKNGKTVKRTEYLLPDGTREWREQTEAGETDRIGKPTGNTDTVAKDGRTIKRVEYILPDGTKEWREQATPSEGNRPLPDNMPKFVPDPNLAGLGLVDYVHGLTALRSQRRPDGTPMLTEAEFAQLVSLAHQQASTEASRLDTITRAQQTQQTNEINQRTTDMQLSSNRLTAANAATQNALDTSLKMAGNFTNDTYRSAGGPILPAVMALQDARAMAWGGMNTPPPVGTAGYPALQQVGQMGLTPAQQPNTVIPAVSALAPAAAPVAAPGATPARPPLFAPRTNMPTPNPPPAAPVAPGQSPPAAPVQNPALVNTDPYDGATPVAAPLAAPAQPAPDQSSPFVGGSVLPQPPDQMPVPVPYPTSPGAVSMQQPGVLPAVNTLGIAAEVAAAGGYSPEVMQMALKELRWA